MRLRCIRATVVACAFFCVTSVLAATFTPLGTFQGGSFSPGRTFYSAAHDVSADGRVVVGQAYRSNVGIEAFRWTATAGMQGLGDFPTGDFWSSATAVSGDGTVIVGDGTVGIGNGIDAFRCTEETGLVPIGYLPVESQDFAYSYALGVSVDGSVVVGGSRSFDGNEPFRWTPEDGIIGLGHHPSTPLPSGSGNYVLDVSADGETLVGIMRTEHAPEPFRWTRDEGFVGLGFLPGLTRETPATAISADGTTIVGHAYPAGWRWTEETGMVALPQITTDPSLPILPRDVSADGSTIVGETSLNRDGHAFIWTAEGGTGLLQHVLADRYGLSLDGWMLTSADAISDNGTVIVGRGITPSGLVEGWVINLVPEPSSFLLAFVALLSVFGIRNSAPTRKLSD